METEEQPVTASVRSSRPAWALAIAAIIAAGLLSRSIRTGSVIFDKYLGDALYAAMIYAILRLFAVVPRTAAIASAGMMLAIEFFQLTLIPARLLASESAILRIIARLLGVQFGFLDLASYAVGIAAIYWLDSRPSRRL